MVGSGYQFFRGRSLKRLIAGFLLGIGLSISIVACSSVGGSRSQVELTLVSFAVTRSAYESILPLFAAKWKAEHQQDVVFNQSYGGSGAQARSVVDGLDADVVNLALALDVKRIEKAGLLQAGWDQRIPHGAIVTHSVVDTNVDKHGTRAVAEAFVQFLFTPEAQREFAKAGFRPVDQQIAQEFAAQYPKVNDLFTVKELGGWGRVQAKFFDDGAVFDQIQAGIRG